jgi:hypothetical protein
VAGDAVGLAKEFGYKDEELNRSTTAARSSCSASRTTRPGSSRPASWTASGNIDLSKIPTGEAEPTDPRLTAPDPQKTLGRSAVRAARRRSDDRTAAGRDRQHERRRARAFEKANPGKIDELAA